QLEADFRLPVQVVAEPGEVSLHFPGVCGNRHVYSLSAVFILWIHSGVACFTFA
ncbi:MAG: hypothetical protein QOH40_2644, partial [Arthrobacter pascens]|nr:hypothetical protein [Arthrobacter pascens]